MSNQGWLRGVVSEVGGGDVVTISGAAKPGGGVPPQKRLILSSIMAPKLGKRDGSTKDEPFAWDAREFLRKLVIGQSVVFKVDYTLEAAGGREFGSVFLGQKNVAEELVRAGLAKVRAGAQQSPFIEALKQAEEGAQAAGLGVWTKDPGVQQAAIRSVPEAAFHAATYLAAVGGKGSVVRGIVEQVANGAMLRVTLLPDYQQATVMVCGVQAPSMGRKAAPAATPAPAEGGDGATPAPPPPSGPSAASIAGSSAPEPFGPEAKFLTESRALGREIRLVLEGVDKFENLFASVYVPPPPTPAAPAAPPAGGAAPPAPAAPSGAQEESLAEVLVRAGYAKAVEWQLALLSNGAQRLRELERSAKQERRAIWANYVPPPTNQAKLSDTFRGKVVEVVSGDCLVIKDAGSGLERRVQLSSLRGPRMGTRDRQPDPWAVDAREFLRKRLIGREVDVKMEYTRKVPVGGEGAGGGAGGGGEDRVLAFGNVELVADKPGGEEAQNVGEMVTARGFATVIRHRSDEERSCVYDRLLECETLAKGAKRGVHSDKEPAANRINDVSLPGSAAKAKQYLPFFQRAGKMLGVVEFVLSGQRLKITIPKEGTTIVFSPSGIKTPARPQPAANGKPAVAGEPFAEEAWAFTREHALQRECEIAVETMDKGGTFLGTITILPALPGGKPVNLAVSLVRAGLARLQPGWDPARLTNGAELAEAQRAAKEGRLKIWQNWAPEQDKVGTEEEEGGGAAAGPGGAPTRALEVMDVVVTEVVDASEFYVQRIGEPRVAWLTEQLRVVAAADAPVIPPELKPGQLCVAQYSGDGQWYRAYVEKALGLSGQYDLFFVDYGNRERVSDKCVRPIDASLAAVPFQAHQCGLAFVKVPLGGAEYAADARGLLQQLLSGGLQLTATVVSRERAGPKDNAKHPKWANGRASVTLTDPATQADLAVELLTAGLARLPKLSKVRDARTKEALTALQPFEEEAREARRGVFTYGDPGDSEDEDRPAAPKPAGAWGKR